MKDLYYNSTKGFDIPFSWDSDFGWDVYGQSDIKDEELIGRVAAVYRVLELNAWAVANIPFVLKQGDSDYDTSVEWQNKVGFMPRPRDLLRRWRAAISIYNTAYAMFDRIDGKLELRYIAPSTIKIDADPAAGIRGFYRQKGGSQIYIPNDDKTPLFYMFVTGYETEIMPSRNTELKAMSDSARIMYATDHFVGDYFERGAIPAHLFAVKGMPSVDEAKRMENALTKLMRGVRGVLGKVWNADALDVKKIGTGVDDFRDNEFYHTALQNISMAGGPPLGLLLSNENTYATAAVDYKSWYETKVYPMAEFFQEEMNLAIFSKMGLKWDFITTQADVDYQEEVNKSQAFVNYSGALRLSGNPRANSIAAEIIGIDLPAGLEYEDLDEKSESEEPQQPMTEQPQREQGAAEPEIGAGDTQKSFVPSPSQVEDLALWQQVVERKYHKGNWPPSRWESKRGLPDPLIDSIQQQLDSVKAFEDIAAAFDLTETEVPQYQPATDTQEIKALAEAMNKWADAIYKQPASINITTPPTSFVLNEKAVTVQPAEVKQAPPMVTVQVPEQPAPIVNVTNEVQTPSVTVNNEMPEPKVIINRPTSAKVKRGKDGKIEGIDAE